MPNLATARTSLTQIARTERAVPSIKPAASESARRAPWLARLRQWLRGDARLAERLNAVDWSL